MRKVLAVLIMLLIGSIYVLSIKQEDSEVLNNHMEQDTSVSTNKSKRLKELEDTLDVDYPNTPKEVIAIHNELMAYQYSESVTADELEDLVMLIRELYAVELLELNSYDNQLKTMIQEVLVNEEQGVYLVSSEIETIEFRDHQLTVVEAVHHMTTDSIERTYYLVKEEEQWKIHSWSDS